MLEFSWSEVLVHPTDHCNYRYCVTAEAICCSECMAQCAKYGYFWEGHKFSGAATSMHRDPGIRIVDPLRTRLASARRTLILL